MRACIALALVLCACADPGEPATGVDAETGAEVDAAPATGDELAALSDDFEGSGLDASWSVKHGDVIDLRVEGGALHLAPTAYVIWYQDDEGALVSKPVTGDFRVTATVHARRATMPAAPPAQPVDLGGLMARDPASDGGHENYVFIVLGHDADDLSVETKTTVNGTSTYTGPTWPSGDAELELCRSGATFTLSKRAVGATTWQVAATFQRPDLPATLQVGANVYAPNPSPDLDVGFDQLTFAAADGC